MNRLSAISRKAVLLKLILHVVHIYFIFTILAAQRKGETHMKCDFHISVTCRQDAVVDRWVDKILDFTQSPLFLLSDSLI